eukprot:3340347-Pyramimonas_sp.AAC.1
MLDDRLFIIQQTCAQPVVCHEDMLPFACAFLGRLADPEERRLAQARSKAFISQMRQSLVGAPGPVHRWTKLKGWKLAQGRTPDGLS